MLRVRLRTKARGSILREAGPILKRKREEGGRLPPWRIQSKDGVAVHVNCDRLQDLPLTTVITDSNLKARTPMSDDLEINPYELLALSTEATDQDIRTAYRKLSLKVHPDRVCVIHPSDHRSHSLRFLQRTGITQKQVRRVKPNPR